MPLESATFINDLEPANPASTDQLAQADEHLRLIKQTLQTTFPNITGPVTVSQDELNYVFALPVGLILNWYGSAGTVPEGWAVCDGQTVARSDGSGNITVPDLRDRVVVGAGTIAQGATAGAATSTVNSSSAGDHTHTVGGGAHTHTATTDAVNGAGTISTSQITIDKTGNVPGTAIASATLTGATHSHVVTVAESAVHSHTVSNGGAHQHSVQVSTLQPSMGLHFIMKV